MGKAELRRLSTIPGKGKNAANKRQAAAMCHGSSAFKAAYEAQVAGLRQVEELQFTQSISTTPGRRLQEALELSSQFGLLALTSYGAWVDMDVCNRWRQIGEALKTRV